MHKIAFIAVLFASLAPSVSHALAGQSRTSNYMQEICGVAGKKLFIQVVTTQGNVIETGLSIKTTDHSNTITHHIDHCPFCHAGVSDVAVLQYNPAFIAYLEILKKVVRVDSIGFVQPQILHSAHLSRAPPVLA